LRYFQPLAHDAVEDQRHEADHRVSPYALRQSVIHRGKLDLRFQDSEAALDVGQTLVALHDRLRVERRDVGHKQQFPVKQFGLPECLLVDVVGEQIRLQIDLDDLG